MKNTVIIILVLFSFKLSQAQDSKIFTPNITVKWAPTGLILGSLSLQGEYSFSRKNSLTAKIGLPVTAKHTFDYNDDASFDMKATSFLAGYRMYLSKKHLKGFYLEPYFKYVHQSSEGQANTSLNNRPALMNFTNEYNGAGIGIQFGMQFIIHKRFVIDLFLVGPELNAANNKLRSQESASNSWTDAEANEAAQDIHDFIEKFPFIRNNTKIMVDQTNRTVTANFKGALAGLRTGVSFGLAF